MCAPEGNSEFRFPESLNVSRDEVECFVILQGKKNHFYDNCISRHDNKSKIL